MLIYMIIYSFLFMIKESKENRNETAIPGTKMVLQIFLNTTLARNTWDVYCYKDFM